MQEEDVVQINCVLLICKKPQQQEQPDRHAVKFFRPAARVEVTPPALLEGFKNVLNIISLKKRIVIATKASAIWEGLRTKKKFDYCADRVYALMGPARRSSSLDRQRESKVHLMNINPTDLKL
ncbi:hypothetical protein ACNR90_003145 [Candidozyma auris]